MPAPLSVPVPGLPLDATVPASPPTIPVLVPFLVTSSPVPGAMTGAVEAGVAVFAGGVGAGVAIGVGAGTVVVTVFLSLHAASESAAHNAALTGKAARTTPLFFIILVSLLVLALYLVGAMLSRETLSSRFVAVTQRLDLVVVAARAFVLVAHDLLDFRRQVFFERLAIAINRDIFAALAFVQHRLIVV